MDKSITIKRLENIKCNVSAFPEFPNLLFGESIDKSVQYFNASDYIKQLGFDGYSPESFLSAYFHPISALASALRLREDRLCIRNAEGQILLDSNLVYLFISYVNPDFLAHLNNRIDELFKQGFCVSDTYLYRNFNSRIAPESTNKRDDGAVNQKA